MQEELIRVALAHQEILPSNGQIVIQCREDLDPRTVRDAVAVSGAYGTTTVDDVGQLCWRPSDDCRPARCALHVGPFRTVEGRVVGEALTIPFRLSDTRVPVPSGSSLVALNRVQLREDRVERVARFDCDATEFIDLAKIYDRATGALDSVAYDACGREVDFRAVQMRLADNARSRYGKIHPTLHDAMAAGDAARRYDVAIWIEADRLSVEARLRSRAERKRTPDEERHRRHVSARSQAFARDIAQRDALSYARADRIAPLVMATLTAAQVKDLAEDERTIAIFMHESEGIDDLADAMLAANAEDAQTLGATGNGVDVAVWETGPDDTKDLAIAGFFDDSQSSTSSHARIVCGIIKNIEPFAPNGFAPDCDLYSANSKSLSALAWAVDEIDCSVINQSFHRASEPASGALSLDDVYKDYLALHWPYPTIVQAAGNFFPNDTDNITPIASEFVNHKGFNTLTVANHNDARTRIANVAQDAFASVFRNPNSPSGDRELPEISANGTRVSAVGVSNFTGTSFASPCVAGAAAQIQQVEPILKGWPEGCRAILLAGASRNVSGSNWWQDVDAGIDAADGAGALDCRESVRIAQNPRNRDSQSTRRGWDIGTIADDDYDNQNRSTFVYRMHAPQTSAGPWSAKVALAWASEVEPNGFLANSLLTQDLDIEIFDGDELAAGSWSRDNSYEIAQFSARPGRVYTIRIRRSAGQGRAFYGIAWRITGGFLLVDPDDLFNGFAPPPLG